MNILQTLSALGLSLFLFSACNSDLDTTTYDASQAQPAVLQSIAEDAYVLDVQKAEETAMTIQWSEPEMGYDASVTTSLEVDLKSKSFSKPIILASTKTDTSYALTVAELNKVVTKLLEVHEVPFGAVDVEFRMASSISKAVKTIYSNIVSTHVTPYAGEKEYPSIAVRGDYSGWDFAASQKVYSEKSDHSYAGMIFFGEKAANGWKFCGDENWSVDNWGAAAAGEAELPTQTLVSGGGGDIKNYSKVSYLVEFNNLTGELKMSKGHHTWGIAGDHSGWGSSADEAMTFATEQTNGKTVQYLTATIAMEANNSWKIRPDNGWDDAVGDNAVEGDFESAGKDNNFKVSEAGTYTIKWYFNKVKGRLTVTKQ